MYFDSTDLIFTYSTRCSLVAYNPDREGVRSTQDNATLPSWWWLLVSDLCHLVKSLETIIVFFLVPFGFRGQPLSVASRIFQIGNSWTLSIHPFIHPSIHPAIQPSSPLFVLSSVRPSVRPYNHPNINTSFYGFLQLVTESTLFSYAVVDIGVLLLLCSDPVERWIL